MRKDDCVIPHTVDWPLDSSPSLHWFTYQRSSEGVVLGRVHPGNSSLSCPGYSFAHQASLHCRNVVLLQPPTHPHVYHPSSQDFNCFNYHTKQCCSLWPFLHTLFSSIPFLHCPLLMLHCPSSFSLLHGTHTPLGNKCHAVASGWLVLPPLLVKDTKDGFQSLLKTPSQLQSKTSTDSILRKHSKYL